MMGNMLLWAVIFALSTSIFSFSFSLSGVARTFEGLDSTYMQETIDSPTVTEGGVLLQPYFEEERVKKLVNEYFALNLRNYVSPTDWELDYGFDGYLLQTYDGDIRTSSKPSKAVIRFSCVFATSYHYENCRSFTIERGERHGA